jgi:hypothetical protein
VAVAAECALVAAGNAAFEYEEALYEVENFIAKPVIAKAAAQADKANKAAQYAYNIALLQPTEATVNRPIFEEKQTEAAARRRKRQVNILFLFDS